MSANSFKMRLMMAMKNAAKSRRKAARKASRKRRSVKKKVSRKASRKRRSVKRKVSRKASAYALFTKDAYAGKVKGLKLKSLKNLSTEDRKKAFKANAKAISAAYKKVI
jgi:hypothetical protein